jgi:hypothetical protein
MGWGGQPGYSVVEDLFTKGAWASLSTLVMSDEDDQPKMIIEEHDIWCKLLTNQ